FGVVGRRTLSARPIPYQNGQVIGQQISRTKRSHTSARSRDPRRSRQMTLLADTVTARSLEPGRIHDVALRLEMLLAEAVGALAAYTAFEKRRIEVAVLRLLNRLRAAGMAKQTWFFDRLSQIDIGLACIAGRQVPVPGRGVIGNGSLKQEAIHLESVTSSYAS